MNERLQKKIDELKKNRNPDDFHPLMCFDANPPKTEYEMPEDYQQYLAQYLEFIEKRDFVAKELPNLLPQDIPSTRAALSELTRAIDNIEATLEKNYREYQQEQREEQELNEATDLQEQISEEHFIMVKHLKPHIFKKFKEFAFQEMTEAEIEEQLAVIASREAVELDGILAGDIQAPEFVNPHIRRLSPYDLLTRQMNDLAMLAFETDEFFKQHHKAIDDGHETRIKFAFQMHRALPVLRQRLDRDIRQLEPALRTASNYLQHYFEENKTNGKFTEIENADEKKIEKCFERLDGYWVEIFVANKHLKPETFSEYEKFATEIMTPEEKEEFYVKVAECEEKSLDVILKAVANEIH